jgi:hypothetical protein
VVTLSNVYVIAVLTLVCIYRCGASFNWDNAEVYHIDSTSAAHQAKITSDRAAAAATLAKAAVDNMTAKHPTATFIEGFQQCSSCETDICGPLLQCINCSDSVQLCTQCQHTTTDETHSGHVFKIVQPPIAAAVVAVQNQLAVGAYAAYVPRPYTPPRGRRHPFYVCAGIMLAQISMLLLIYYF